jgi:hypothetical protein
LLKKRSEKLSPAKAQSTPSSEKPGKIFFLCALGALAGKFLGLVLSDIPNDRRSFMSDATISLSILAAVVVLFVWNRFPVELVAVAAALVLYFTGC